MLNIYIGDADRTNLLLARSLSITDSIQGIDSCRFDLISDIGKFRPSVQKTVMIATNELFAAIAEYAGEYATGESFLGYQFPDNEIVFTRASTTTFRTSTLAIDEPRIAPEGIYVERAVNSANERLVIKDSPLAKSYNAAEDSKHFSLGATFTRTKSILNRAAQTVYYQNNTVTREAFVAKSVTNGVTYRFSFLIGKSGAAPVSTGANAQSNFQVVINGAVITSGITVYSLPNSGWEQNLYYIFVDYVATSTASVLFGVRLSTANAASEFWMSAASVARRHPNDSNVWENAALLNTFNSYIARSNVSQGATDTPLYLTNVFGFNAANDKKYFVVLTPAGEIGLSILNTESSVEYNYLVLTGITALNAQRARVAFSVDNGNALISVNGSVPKSLTYKRETSAATVNEIECFATTDAIYSDVSVNTRPLDSVALTDFSELKSFTFNYARLPNDFSLSTPEDVQDYIKLFSSIPIPYNATGFRYFGAVAFGALQIRAAISFLAAVQVAGQSKLFGGFINSFDEELVIRNSSKIKFTIECGSYAQILGKRLVVESYENTTVASIVDDIMNKYLLYDVLDDNFYITDYTEIPSIRFNYQSALDCFNMLAEISGAIWFIDADRRLYFIPRDGVTYYDGLFAMDASTKNFLDVKVRNSAQDYRNRQYIRAGLGLTSSRTESFIGNGVSTSATTSYPIAETPTLNYIVGGTPVAKTVGIREIDSGKDAYWQKGSNILTFSVAPANNQSIQLTYVGQYPVLTQSIDEQEVLRVKAAQGGVGTGFVDHLQDEPDIESAAASIERGVALLRKYARIPRAATIRTMDPFVGRVGFLIQVDIPAHNMSGFWLVESVTITDMNGFKLMRQITLLDGESVGGWQEFFGSLKRSTRKFNFRDNEVLLLSRNQAEQVRITDTFTAVVS